MRQEIAAQPPVHGDCKNPSQPLPVADSHPPALASRVRQLLWTSSLPFPPPPWLCCALPLAEGRDDAAPRPNCIVSCCRPCCVCPLSAASTTGCGLLPSATAAASTRQPKVSDACAFIDAREFPRCSLTGVLLRSCVQLDCSDACAVTNCKEVIVEDPTLGVGGGAQDVRSAPPPPPPPPCSSRA